MCLLVGQGGVGERPGFPQGVQRGEGSGSSLKVCCVRGKLDERENQTRNESRQGHASASRKKRYADLILRTKRNMSSELCQLWHTSVHTLAKIG